MSEAAATGGDGVATTGSTGGVGGNTAIINANGGGSGGGSTPAGASSTPSDWTSGLNDDFKGYVQNKGFKDPAAVLDSYRNLEKLMGAPKERLLKLPEKADDPAWNEVYGKLGRPEKADDYSIQGDPEFSKWAKGTFHKLGISKTQAEKLVTEWGEFTGQQSKTQLDASHAKATEEDRALKQEWGHAYDQHTNLARRAVKEFGMDAPTIDKLESALGYSGVMKLMHNIGSKLGESSFVAGSSGSAPGFNAMAPEAARNQIQSLRGDPEFVRRYTNNDLEARQRMEHLHRMAYPE